MVQQKIKQAFETVRQRVQKTFNPPITSAEIFYAQWLNAFFSNQSSEDIKSNTVFLPDRELFSLKQTSANRAVLQPPFIVNGIMPTTNLQLWKNNDGTETATYKSRCMVTHGHDTHDTGGMFYLDHRIQSLLQAANPDLAETLDKTVKQSALIRELTDPRCLFIARVAR